MKPYCKGAPAGAMTMGGERSEAHPVLISVEAAEPRGHGAGACTRTARSADPGGALPTLGLPP